jgi:hypothetical protein
MLDGMIGALVLGALALAGGATDPLWVSGATPIAGTTYRAVSHSGPAALACSGRIAGGPTVKSWLQLEDKTWVCMIQVPLKTAGKTLEVDYTLTTNDGDQVSVAESSAAPRVITAAPVPRAGRPFLVVLSPSDGELKCEGGKIGRKRVGVSYQHGEGTVACFLLIPKGTAGKWLLWSCTHYFSTPLSFRGYDASGHPTYGGSSMVADCLGQRTLIRR